VEWVIRWLFAGGQESQPCDWKSSRIVTGIAVVVGGLGVRVKGLVVKGLAVVAAVLGE